MQAFYLCFWKLNRKWFECQYATRYLKSYVILLSSLLAIKEFLWERMFYVDAYDDYRPKILWQGHTPLMVYPNASNALLYPTFE